MVSSSSRGQAFLAAVIGAALVATLAAAACPSSAEHAFVHPFFGTALHHHHEHPDDFFEAAADDLAVQLNDLQTRLTASENNAANLRSRHADAMQELRKMKCVNQQLRKQQHVVSKSSSRGGFSCCSFAVGLITALGVAMLGVHRRRLALAGSSALGHVTAFLQRPDVQKAAFIAWKILRVLFFVLVALSFPGLGCFGFFVAPALLSVAMISSCCCWRRPRIVVVRPPTVAAPTARPASETTQPPKEASSSPSTTTTTTTTPPEHTQLTRVLVSMGYDEVQAAEAVKATGSLELATDWILVREQDEQSPPQDQQSPTQKEAEQDEQSPPQDQQSPTQKEAEPNNHLNSVSDEEPGAAPDKMTKEEPTPTTPMNQYGALVTELKEMGFDGELAQTAAERASGNLKSAVRILVERERNTLSGSLASDW